MDVKEIRLNNLNKLINEFGSINELANAINSSPSYISQLKNGSGNKSMGDKYARNIEVAIKKPHGWMDKDHDSDPFSHFDSNNTEQLVEIGLDALNEAFDKVEKVCAKNGKPVDKELLMKAFNVCLRGRATGDYVTPILKIFHGY